MHEKKEKENEHKFCVGKRKMWDNPVKREQRARVCVCVCKCTIRMRALDANVRRDVNGKNL